MEMLHQGTLNEGESSVQMTSSFRQLALGKRKIYNAVLKAPDLNQLVHGGQQY